MFKMAQGKTLAEAYNNALVLLDQYGGIYPCEAYSTEYKTVVQKEISLLLSVKDVTQEPVISKFFLSGPEALQDYELEFLYGVRDFNVEAYEKGLEPNFWPYTYHQRIEQNDQVDFILDELIRDKESRRAVILIRDNKTDMNTKDPACLQEFFFQIRDNKLNMTATMRSNDATEASGMNMYEFIKFQIQMVDKIKKRALEYIDIIENSENINSADAINYLKSFLNLKPGEYNHLATSYHAYGELLSEKDYSDYLKENEGITLEEDKMLGTAINYKDGYVVGEIRRLQKNANRIKSNKLEDLSFNLEGKNGWKEMMHERICPSLAELTIEKSIEYGLFDEKQIRIIENVLIDYNIPFKQLTEECQKRGIDLAKEYGNAGMEVPGTNPKVKNKTL